MRRFRKHLRWIWWSWSEPAMHIPHTELSADALTGIIEEYVSREGTEYGARDYSLEEKVQQVMQQLQRGEAVIDYDPDSQTCQLLPLRSSTRDL